MTPRAVCPPCLDGRRWPDSIDCGGGLLRWSFANRSKHGCHSCCCSFLQTISSHVPSDSLDSAGDALSQLIARTDKRTACGWPQFYNGTLAGQSTSTLVQKTSRVARTHQ